MRIDSVSHVGIFKSYKNIRKHPLQEPPVPNQPHFKGKVGSIAGVVVGGAAAIGLAALTAPVLVCAGPLLGALGAIAGSNAEDTITKNLKK